MTHPKIHSCAVCVANSLVISVRSTTPKMSYTFICPDITTHHQTITTNFDPDLCMCSNFECDHKNNLPSIKTEFCARSEKHLLIMFLSSGTCGYGTQSGTHNVQGRNWHVVAAYATTRGDERLQMGRSSTHTHTIRPNTVLPNTPL